MNKGIKKIQESQFRNWAENNLGDNSDKVDVGSYYDSSLTLAENKTLFEKNVLHINHVTPSQMVDSEYEDYVNEEVRKNHKPRADLKSYFTPIYEAIEKAKMRHLCLLFIKGAGGTGKSYNIEQALKEHGMEYVVFQEVTQATIPMILYENKDSVIWIKDVAKVLNNPIALDLIKACSEMNLDKEHKYLPRRISISKFSHELKKAGVPNEFDFNGVIIFDYNALNHTNYLHDYTALKSRGTVIDVAFSREEMAEIMLKIANTPWETEVSKYMIENANMYTPLNLRMQQDAFIEYIYSKHKKFDWKERIKSKVMNKKTHNQMFIRSLIGDTAVKRTTLESLLSRTDEYAHLSDRTIRRRIDTMIRREELYNVSGHIREPLLSVNPMIIKETV